MDSSSPTSDYEHISHDDTPARVATPPRVPAAETNDKTPVQSLSSLDDSLPFSPAPAPAPPAVEPVKEPFYTVPITAPVDEPSSSPRVSPAAPPAVPAKFNKAAKSAPVREPEPSDSGCGCSCDITKYYHHLNWEDPVKTGLLFCGGLVLFFVFGVLRYRVLSFGAHLFLFAGVATGLVAAMTANNIRIGTLSLENLREPLRCCETLPEKLGECVVKTTSRVVNVATDVLMWYNPIRSLKVLASVWLLTHQGCCLFGKAPLFLLFLAMFTLPAAHTHYANQINSFYSRSVRPQLIKAADAASRIQHTTTLVNGVLGCLLGAVLWVVFCSLSSWISLVSTGFLIVQTLPHLKPKAA